MNKPTFVLCLAISLLLTACATAPNGDTTQPSLATVTTQGDTALDAVVLSIGTLNRTTGYPTPAMYVNEVRPIIVSTKASLDRMAADAQAGQSSVVDTNAYLAGLAKLATFLVKPTTP